MGRFARLLAAVSLAFAAVFAGAAGPAAADVDDFVFESMDADYTLGVDDDGSSVMRVVETLVAVFPETDQNRGIRRLLPEKAFGAPIDPRLVSVTDEDGRPRPSETDSEDDVYSIVSRADDYVHGAQTYVITYTLRNVTPYFPRSDTEEFYWNVNGVDWAQPFGEVTGRLHIAADLAGALTGDEACYAGSSGATTSCPISSETAADGAVTVTASATDLGPGQTLTFAVGFEPGTFTQFDSSYFASPWGWIQAGSALALGAGLVWAIVVRVRLLRDAKGRPTIIAEYEPPRVVDALESAVLLGKSSKAIPAEVLEQAVVGSIRIVEASRSRIGKPRLEAHLVDPSRADGDGRMLLDGLFGEAAAPGEVFTFGKESSRLSTAARSILSAAGKELVVRGLRRSVPLSARLGPMLLSLFAAGAVLASGFAGLEADVDSWVMALLLIAAIPAALVAIGLLSRKPLTPLGAETRDHLRGLEEFIEWAEADRIRMLQSPRGAERVPVDTGDPVQMLRIYEVLLPYAVVFGQEKQWAERLAVLYESTSTPGWYIGTTAFSASAFASGIGSLSQSATSASATSGGSTGGGSAGGGGGGGGGGGV